mmetsp:Transcript_16290/g.55336  ORF Transcript_16290/g.55336 Transcript_16290/m.55336 type:complete len:438 (+) Transcript_16290:3-1316(+)
MSKMALVPFSGAGPPLGPLYLMPKSSSGPPGLWLALRMKAPKAACQRGPRSRITAEAAGVDMSPPWPSTTRRTPLATAILMTTCAASRLKYLPSPPTSSAPTVRSVPSALSASNTAWTKLWRYVPSMKTRVFFLSPDVPGFWPSYGVTGSRVGRSGPMPGASVRFTVVSTYSPGGSTLGSSLSFTTDTVPAKDTPRAKRTSPLTVRRSQRTSDGTPSDVASSSCPTSLCFLLSSVTTGAVATTVGTLSRSVYASERSSMRSLHFFTGAKRVRGTTTAPAPSKHSIAAPMAVSSWKTAAVLLSWGLTVLPFLMSGSATKPPDASMTSLSLSRRTQRLFVLKNWWRVTSWNAPSSSLAHCADSRSTRWPSPLRTARWPPFLSLSVRRQHSMRKGLSVVAKYERRSRSIVAPRLSELDTNMYLIPSARSASSVPEPYSAE